MRNRFAGWVRSRPLWQFALLVAAWSFAVMFILSLGVWEVTGHTGARPLDLAVSMTIFMTVWGTWVRWRSSRDHPSDRRSE